VWLTRWLRKPEEEEVELASESRPHVERCPACSTPLRIEGRTTRYYYCPVCDLPADPAP
jgi:hypothetical protein